MIATLMVGLEVAGTIALLWGVPSRQLLGFVMGHGAASALAIGLRPLLPPAYRRGKAHTQALLLSALVLLMPIFGLLGLLLLILPVLYRPVIRQDCTWRRISIAGVPVRADAAVRQREPALGGQSLIDILQRSSSVDERVAAVMAVRRLPTRTAVPILRLALRDPADDVRLLAYAMLDRRDAALQSRIQEHEAALEGDTLSPGDTADTHRTLARLHWELSYAGLATGAVEARALESAVGHAQVALALDRAYATQHLPDRGTLFLLGRILLRQGALREAEAALVEARELGIAESSVRPFLAEIAFLERRFEHVRAHLQAGGQGGALRPGIISDLGRFWLPEAA